MHMGHIVIFEITYHLGNRMALSNMRKKLISKSFPLARPFDESCHIHKLHNGRNDFLRIADFSQGFQTRIGHFHHSHIGIDGAKGIIRRLRRVAPRERIEQS